MIGWILVIVLLVLIFGKSSSLSKAGSGLGSAVRKFKEGLGTVEKKDTEKD